MSKPAKTVAAPPKGASLSGLAKAAEGCKACDLWKTATQTVFGKEGGPHPKLMLIGEQPGNSEDLAGSPFVGPAGKLLFEVLQKAGIDQRNAYVTNVVKHFKWEPRGKRRIHKKPNAAEIAACRPWLEAEIAAVAPRVIVCLGATPARALLGKDFRVTKQRGELVASRLAPYVTATVHPSSILRAPDEKTRHRELDRFFEDLNKVAKMVKGDTPPVPAGPIAEAG